MEIVKSLVGGLIGGAVGAAVANLIQQASGFSSSWFLLLIGLGTGLGVRAAAGANRSFVTGVVGAVTTIVVLYGSTVVTSLAEVSSKASDVAITKIESTDDPNADEAADADEAGDDAEAAADAGEQTDDAAAEDAGDDAEQAAEEQPEWDPEEEAAARAATAAASGATAPTAADGSPLPNPALDELEKQQNWTVVDYLFNGVAALLAFAISSGSGSNVSRSEPVSESKD